MQENMPVWESALRRNKYFSMHAAVAKYCNIQRLWLNWPSEMGGVRKIDSETGSGSED